MKTISIIVAIAENDAIGKDNQLLWHIPADLKRFKAITTGHTIVMGRRTFESLPNGPLPKRRNVVISRHAVAIPGCVMADSIEDAISKMEEGEENFVIGGAEVYRQFMPLADKLYLTLVHKEFDADTFYPAIDFDEWVEVERQDLQAKETLGFDYSYVTYHKKE